MSERSRICAIAALLSGILGFAAASAQGQASRPNPPQQICVNNQCWTNSNSPNAGSGGGGGGTNSNPPSAGSGSGGGGKNSNSPSAGSGSGGGGTTKSHQIKWNPGHYMASYGVIYGNSKESIAPLQSEMDDLDNQDAIVGYRIWISWGAIERTQGNYDFSVLDAALARLKSAYNKPKHLIIGLWMYGQHTFNTTSDDWRVLPMYIQRGSQYGNSPVAGSYGWWGQNSNGRSTGEWAPAFYNKAVMDRFIAMVQALGHHFDSDPYVEGLYIQENSAVAQAAGNSNPADPNYSDQAWLQQLERLLSASTAAFPHTSVIMSNTWFVMPQAAVALEEWMANNRIAPSAADTWAQSAITTYGTSHLADGIQTLLGVDPNGGVGDLRPKMRAMMDVESDELTGTGYGGPWAPLDILNALNQTYWASHAFWTHFFPGTTLNNVPIPTVAIWSNMAATVSAHPLIHTDYPANYP